MNFTEIFQKTPLSTIILGLCWLYFLVFNQRISQLLAKIIYPIFKSKLIPHSLVFFQNQIAKPLQILLILALFFIPIFLLEFPCNTCFYSAYLPFVYKLFWLLFIPITTWLIMGFIRYFAKIFEAKAAKTESKSDDQLVYFIKDLCLILVVLFGFLLTIAKVFEVNVFTIITGLGIGGLAIALAARDTLENLFSSFTLFLDKPFVQGDTIQVGTITGEVEKVGFRSAILRSPEGASISVPSRLLTTQTVENQTERSFRRGKIVIKISFENSAKRVQKLIKEIEQILNQKPELTPADSHVRLDAFHDYGMELHILYHAQIADSDQFKNFRSALNMEIWAIFEHHKINFVKLQPGDFNGNENKDSEIDTSTIGVASSFSTQNIIKQNFDKTNETNQPKQ